MYSWVTTGIDDAAGIVGVDFTANATNDVVVMLSPRISTEGSIHISYRFTFGAEGNTARSIEGFDNGGFSYYVEGGALDSASGLNNLFVSYSAGMRSIGYGQGFSRSPSVYWVYSLEPEFEYEDMEHVYFRSGNTPITITNIRVSIRVRR